MAIQGDSVWDLLAARRAGCLGIGVLSEDMGKKRGLSGVSGSGRLTGSLDEVGIRIMDQVVKEQATRSRTNLLRANLPRQTFHRSPVINNAA